MEGDDEDYYRIRFKKIKLFLLIDYQKGAKSFAYKSR